MSSEQKPLVSILAVSYNHERYVRETLESIRNQSYSNIELVILDDYSSDNTVQIIRDWIEEFDVDCKFIAHQENKGVCKTFNEGLSNCSGKYYFSVSCDDILFLDKVLRQVEFFEKQGEDVGMIYTNAEMFFEDNPGRKEVFIDYHRKDALKPSGNIFEELMKRNFIPGMTALIRLDVLNSLGGFDEELLYEDYDMWLRIANKYQIVYMNAVMVKYRMHECNLHKSMQENESYVGSVFRMLLKYPENKVAQERILEIGYRIGAERIKNISAIKYFKGQILKHEKQKASLHRLNTELFDLFDRLWSNRCFVFIRTLSFLVGGNKVINGIQQKVRELKVQGE